MTKVTAFAGTRGAPALLRSEAKLLLREKVAVLAGSHALVWLSRRVGKRDVDWADGAG